MTRPARILLRRAALLVLIVLCSVSTMADGLKLTAAFGIAGHYRPGTWCPVTVTVSNPDGNISTGQVQILAEPTPGQGYGASNTNLGHTLFARPVSLSGSGSQNFTVFVRGIDPGRDTVTVQLVEGRQRGDGRVLARTDNEPGNAAPTITGTPLTDSDIFAVGFAGDPGAFTYFNTQKPGLSRQPEGTLTPMATSMPQPMQYGPRGQMLASEATVQVASAAASDLPDKAAGYSGLDTFFLRSDAPLDALTESQADALKGWVASGGHLIVFCAGSDPTPFGSSFYAGLLPATVGPAGAGGRLKLTPKPMPGIQSIMGASQTITGSHGAGRVTVTTINEYAAPRSLFIGSDFQALMLAGQGSAPTSLLSYIAAREENNTTSYYYGPQQTLLSDAVMRAPSLDAPGTEVIGVFLVVYLIALVPANYLILKRLDRKELAWVTIPLLVIIFAVGTFAVGYASKGGSVFVNRAAIIETTAGQRDAGVYADVGLFSPRRTSYDIHISGANALAAVPNPGSSYGFRSRSDGAEMQAGGQTKFVQSPDGVTLLDTSVNMWAMRAFDTQSTTDLGGAIDWMPAQATGGSGTVTNHTNHDLTDCVLLYDNHVLPLGSLVSGASLPISPGRNVGSPGTGLNIPPLPGEVNADDMHGDIHARMQRAIAVFVRSLGTSNGGNYYMNGQAPAAYISSPGEALLFGWSDDLTLAGPTASIDGHTVHENDVSLIVVHLPIGGP